MFIVTLMFFCVYEASFIWVSKAMQIALVLLCSAVWLVQKTPATFLTNHIQN